jgi:hypothetical protein
MVMKTTNVRRTVMEYMLPNAEWKISYDLVEASPLEQNTQLIFHLTLRRNPYFLFLAKNVIKILHRSCMSRKIL